MNSKNARTCFSQILIFFCPLLVNAQSDSTPYVNRQKGEPLEGMDLTWCNGSDRRETPTMTSKFFSPTVMVDCNFTHSFADPVDNTVVGSTALARNNEVQVSAAHIGGDFYYKGARAHIVTQFGTRSTV